MLIRRQGKGAGGKQVGRIMRYVWSMHNSLSAKCKVASMCKTCPSNAPSSKETSKLKVKRYGIIRCSRLLSGGWKLKVRIVGGHLVNGM